MKRKNPKESVSLQLMAAMDDIPDYLRPNRESILETLYDDEHLPNVTAIFLYRMEKERDLNLEFLINEECEKRNLKVEANDVDLEDYIKLLIRYPFFRDNVKASKILQFLLKNDDIIKYAPMCYTRVSTILENLYINKELLEMQYLELDYTNMQFLLHFMVIITSSNTLRHLDFKISFPKTVVWQFIPNYASSIIGNDIAIGNTSISLTSHGMVYKDIRINKLTYRMEQINSNSYRVRCTINLLDARYLVTTIIDSDSSTITSDNVTVAYSYPTFFSPNCVTTPNYKYAINSNETIRDVLQQASNNAYTEIDPLVYDKNYELLPGRTPFDISLCEDHLVEEIVIEHNGRKYGIIEYVTYVIDNPSMRKGLPVEEVLSYLVNEKFATLYAPLSYYKIHSVLKSMKVVQKLDGINKRILFEYLMCLGFPVAGYLKYTTAYIDPENVREMIPQNLRTYSEVFLQCTHQFKGLICYDYVNFSHKAGCDIKVSHQVHSDDSAVYNRIFFCLDNATTVEFKQEVKRGSEYIMEENVTISGSISIYNSPKNNNYVLYWQNCNAGILQRWLTVPRIKWQTEMDEERATRYYETMTNVQAVQFFPHNSMYTLPTLEEWIIRRDAIIERDAVCNYVTVDGVPKLLVDPFITIEQFLVKGIAIKNAVKGLSASQSTSDFNWVYKNYNFIALEQFIQALFGVPSLVSP